ncbi:hypothetical protein DFJ73DRAFT_762367 [Zopfochytrium polystomum]|nr:hypothetical protein DFJ73DRAFT_762367 [Zopfochytrium polystomum]
MAPVAAASAHFDTKRLLHALARRSIDDASDVLGVAKTSSSSSNCSNCRGTSLSTGAIIAIVVVGCVVLLVVLIVYSRRQQLFGGGGSSSTAAGSVNPNPTQSTVYPLGAVTDKPVAYPTAADPYNTTTVPQTYATAAAYDPKLLDQMQQPAYAPQQQEQQAYAQPGVYQPQYQPQQTYAPPPQPPAGYYAPPAAPAPAASYGSPYLPPPQQQQQAYRAPTEAPKF